MIFTRIEIDNLYCFRGSEIDLTFPKKLTNNTISSETLPGRDRFHFKRVCILSGPNASGKTAFGKVLCGLQNFIERKVLLEDLYEAVSYRDIPATVVAEFASVDDLCLHKVSFSFMKGGAQIKSLKYAKVPINKNDSALVARKNLEKIFNSSGNFKQRAGVEFISSGSTDFEKLEAMARFAEMTFSGSWCYLFSDTEASSKLRSTDTAMLNNTELLEIILKIFDPSIQDVSETFSNVDGKKQELNGFRVKFKNGDTALVDLKGDATGFRRFSKGTFDSIKVANFVARIKNSSSETTTFFLDEQLAHAHSELEVNLLNVMIEFLGATSQLFFTTHNYHIMDMNLPNHSFAFLAKDDEFSRFVLPEKTHKKNDRAISNAVKNNVFKTIPNVHLLDKFMVENSV